MIVTENLVREDGVKLIRTYSDKGMKIERDGVRYEEAIDPAELNRVYTETDEPIEGYTDPTEATEADYQNALRDMGVQV